MSEPVIKWCEGEPQSYQEAVTSMLKFIDEHLEKEGWDAKPVLGVVSLSNIESLGALSVDVPTMPDIFYEDFDEALPVLAHMCLTAETENDPECQGFLDQGVTKDFIGWLVSAEFNGTQIDKNGQPIGEPMEQRITLCVDLNSNKYGVVRNRGEDCNRIMSDLEPNNILSSLGMLVAASIMSVVRRDLQVPSGD